MGHSMDQMPSSEVPIAAKQPAMRLELPGNRVVGLRLIGAEVAGADRGRQNDAPRPDSLEANFLHHRADPLADRPASAFCATRCCARASAKS